MWIVEWIVSIHKVAKRLILKGGSSSVAERQLPKLNVAGSIPVSRSNKINDLQLEISWMKAPSGALNTAENDGSALRRR